MANSDTQLVLCYNKGCGQTFDPEKNTLESCVFHPGAPVFHDAYKGWSCCSKKCTDFTEFLNIKGCTKSVHSNVKPVEPEKPKQETSNDEVYVYEAPKPIKPEIKVERPDDDFPMTKLKTTVTASLKDLLAKQINENLSKVNLGPVSTEVQVGTACKNGGCKKDYKGEESNSEACTHHPGVPIFHEGLKFWSCCKKRTTDFNSFLEQEGCTSGSHIWIKPDAHLTQVECRYDWHQTGTNVVIAIYAKGCDPQKSYFEANPVKLHVVASYGDGIFDKEFILQGVIDVESSCVTMAAAKLEIKLKKANAFSWRKLNLTSEELEKLKQK